MSDRADPTHRLPPAEALLAEARARTGIGLIDREAVQPLTVLVKSLNQDGALHAAGAAAMHARLGRILSNRLRMRRDFAAHPDIAAERVLAPVFICGMARTGSTKTQKLLAASGDFNWLPYWQVLNPALISGDRSESTDARIADTDTFARWFDAASPETRYGHHFETHEPEEESFILEHSLRTPTFMGWAPLNGYLDWLGTQDMATQFEWLRDTLKYLQWQGLALRTRRWILKSPLYSGLEPLLLRTFPDARLVMTHRHPQVTIPSGLRLLECFYKPFTASRPDAAYFVAGQSAAINAHRAFRATAPSATFLDIDFAELNRDVSCAIGRIYGFASMDFSAAAERRVLAWNASNPQHKHGRHEYSLERYALTPEGIATSFEGYIRFLGERFPTS